MTAARRPLIGARWVRAVVAAVLLIGALAAVPVAMVLWVFGPTAAALPLVASAAAAPPVSRVLVMGRWGPISVAAAVVIVVAFVALSLIAAVAAVDACAFEDELAPGLFLYAGGAMLALGALLACLPLARRRRGPALAVAACVLAATSAGASAAIAGASPGGCATFV